MSDQGSESGSSSPENSDYSTLASDAPSDPVQPLDSDMSLNTQDPNPDSPAPHTYGNTSCQTRSHIPNQVTWSNRTPSSPWQGTAILPNGPIFSVPSELWLQIIGNLDMPGLQRLLSALYFILRPLGLYPPANNHQLPRTLPQISFWLGSGGTLYDVMTSYPYEIVDDIFQQLTPQEKVNVVLALYHCDRR